MLLNGFTEMVSLGPILPTGVVTGYGATAGRIWATFPAVLISWPVNAIFLDPLMKKELTIKCFAEVANVTPAVTSWLTTPDTYFFETDIQAFMSVW